MDVSSVLLRTDPRWACLALLAYLGSYAGRALRFRLLLHSARPPLTDLLAVVSVHNLLNMLLPFRTGELSYVYLARRRYGVSLGEGAATLLLARLFDVIGIAIFFLAALFLERGPVPGGGTLVPGALLLLALSLLSLALLLPGVRWAHAVTERRLGAGRPAGSSRLAGPLLRKARALIDHLERIRARRVSLAVLAVTELQWLFTFAACFCLLRAAGIPFPFGASILGSTGLSVALILPINTFANVGSFEAGWMIGYHLAGLGRPEAMATAVSAHLFILVFAALLGGLGFVALRNPGAGTRRNA